MGSHIFKTFPIFGKFYNQFSQSQQRFKFNTLFAIFYKPFGLWRGKSIFKVKSFSIPLKNKFLIAGSATLITSATKDIPGFIAINLEDNKPREEINFIHLLLDCVSDNRTSDEDFSILINSTGISMAQRLNNTSDWPNFIDDYKNVRGILLNWVKVNVEGVERFRIVALKACAERSLTLLRKEQTEQTLEGIKDWVEIIAELDGLVKL
ncbi:hypothetical protein Fcan01_04784 [Folsomia candida]|uniref:Uncharacterized protein n=1 Tax=Folsomia candida TaxID=158441 RepID=A0A226ETD0_FOLCA|nr:hypothetical protein Fcan01_04784 [Folsomia candida]